MTAVPAAVILATPAVLWQLVFTGGAGGKRTVTRRIIRFAS